VTDGVQATMSLTDAHKTVEFKGRYHAGQFVACHQQFILADRSRVSPRSCTGNYCTQVRQISGSSCMQSVIKPLHSLCVSLSTTRQASFIIYLFIYY